LAQESLEFRLVGREQTIDIAFKCFKTIITHARNTASDRIQVKMPVCSGISGLGKTRMLGYMVSCMVKRVDIAPIIGILFIFLFLLFGGLLLNSDSTPSYLIWLQQISPIKYGFHGLMRAFWSNVNHIECNAGQVCQAATGEKVLDMNSIDPDTMWLDIFVLIALNIAFRLVGALFLLCRIEKKKENGIPKAPIF
jgi:hypothetical protein